MNTYVPFTELQPATLIALYGYDYTPIAVKGENDYYHYFKQRWEAGEAFINIEHDVVPWPGAIEAIEQCERDWCVYNYSLPVHRDQDLENVETAIPLGLIKISSELIAGTKDMWAEPCEWNKLDWRLNQYARSKGFRAHQHFPSIVNANPVLLGLVSKGT